MLRHLSEGLIWLVRLLSLKGKHRLIVSSINRRFRWQILLHTQTYFSIQETSKATEKEQTFQSYFLQ